MQGPIATELNKWEGAARASGRVFTSARSSGSRAATLEGGKRANGASDKVPSRAACVGVCSGCVGRAVALVRKEALFIDSVSITYSYCPPKVATRTSTNEAGFAPTQLHISWVAKEPRCIRGKKSNKVV